jgi:hypothetical protein
LCRVPTYERSGLPKPTTNFIQVIADCQLPIAD